MRGILEWLISPEGETRVSALVEKFCNILLGFVALGVVALVVAQLILGVANG